MKFYKICFVVCLFSVTLQLFAINYEYSGQCRSDNITESFESCLDKELAMYDKELNELYSRFLKRGPHKDLKKIELLWIKYKEADCSYMAREVNGGLQYQFIRNACLINKTKSRIDDLKRSFFYSGWFEKN